MDRFAGLIYHSVNTTLAKSKYMLDGDDIKDLVNTVFLLLHENNYKKLRQFEGNCSLASWIRLISVRLTIDFLRKRKVTLSLNGDSDVEKKLAHTLTNESLSAPEKLEEEERRQIFAEIKKSLTPREQMFVELHYNRELPPRKVAKAMGSSLGAIYTLKNRVREKLKKMVNNFL